LSYAAWGLEINNPSVCPEPCLPTSQAHRFLKVLICGGVCKLPQTFHFGLTPCIIGKVVGRFNRCQAEACLEILSQKGIENP